MKTKLFKKVITLALSSIILLSSMAYAAVGQPYDRLSMSFTGNRYIYSNNPEKITTTLIAGTTGKNIVNRTVTPGQKYDVEYSHTNMTTIPLTVAVILKNNTNVKANIAIYNNAAYQNEAYDVVGSKTEFDYWSIAKYSTKTIDPGKSCVLIRSNLNAADYSTGVGKVLFQSDVAVNCRVAYFKTGTSDDAAGNLSDLTAGDTVSTTTNECLNDGRTIIYDYASAINKAFYLNMDVAYTDSTGKVLDPHNKYNANEFQKPVWYLPSSREYSQGNWGINYNMRLDNAGGKTLYIIPDWTNIKYLGSNSYTIYDPYTSSWKNIKLYKSSLDYAVIKLPNKSSMIFNFVLAGGDCGQEYFTFTAPTTGHAVPVN